MVLLQGTSAAICGLNLLLLLLDADVAVSSIDFALLLSNLRAGAPARSCWRDGI